MADPDQPARRLAAHRPQGRWPAAAGLAASPRSSRRAARGGPTAAAPPAAAASDERGAPPASQPAATGTITFGSNYSDATPKTAMQAVVDGFTAKTGIAVTVNTVDHGKFQDPINAYLQATPDDTFTWFAGFRMSFFANQGLATDISDVWTTVAANYSEAFKAASTGDDGKQYFVPFYNYPWVVIYRKCVFTEKGYTSPRRSTSSTTLGDKMKTDGLIPLAFADKDGWPAMGTFDIINMRINGYDYHIGLMAGAQKWTDAEDQAPCSRSGRSSFPTSTDRCRSGRPGRTRAQHAHQKKAGMYFLGTFAGEQATETADHDDLDFFPFPTLGTEFDAELGIDAPIDGFMMTAKSRTSRDKGAKAFLEYLSTGEAQVTFLVAARTAWPPANDADTSSYYGVPEEVGRDHRRRPERSPSSSTATRDPDFAGTDAELPADLADPPDQDMDAYLKSIQYFWDSLGIA